MIPKNSLHFEPGDVPNFDDTGLFTIEEKMLERIVNEELPEIDDPGLGGKPRGKTAA